MKKIVLVISVMLVAGYLFNSIVLDSVFIDAPLHAQKAIVIGASSGIGKALAEVLANNGYEVGLTGRRADLLQGLQQKLPTKTFVKQMDLRTPEKSMQQLEELIQEMGGLDLIILNAGFAHDDKDLDWQKSKEILDVNVIGFAAMANVALKYFLPQKHGHLVGVSSVCAEYAFKDAFAYAASKSFSSALCQGIRNTVRPTGLPIYVTDIRPGFVDTAMVANCPDKYLESSPREAAEQIYDAIQSHKKIAYVTKRWRIISWALQLAPDWLIDFVV